MGTRGIDTRTAPPVSPGPERSPTEISLAQLAHISSNNDVGEGASNSADRTNLHPSQGLGIQHESFSKPFSPPPPDYTSPEASLLDRERADPDESDAASNPREEDAEVLLLLAKFDPNCLGPLRQALQRAPLDAVGRFLEAPE